MESTRIWAKCACGQGPIDDVLYQTPRKFGLYPDRTCVTRTPLRNGLKSNKTQWLRRHTPRVLVLFFGAVYDAELIDIRKDRGDGTRNNTQSFVKLNLVTEVLESVIHIKMYLEQAYAR